MRVIAGSARGRKLRPVPGSSTRPITDRVKESLFDLLGGDVSGSAFLDLFAGTGGVGIEALSRGAAFARFVDLDSQAIATVRANLRITGLQDRAEVLRMDAFALLGREPDRRFEYVYMAPPQYKGLWKKSLLLLDARPGWLAEDAWAILQIYPGELEPVELANLIEFDRRKYGSTLLIFYFQGPLIGGSADEDG